MLNWLYELPLWIPAAIVVVGLVLLWTGIQRLENRLRRIGLAALIIGVVLGLLSWFLESDREIVIRQTRELVSAIDKRDWATTEKLLHPDVTIFDRGNRQQIMADIKQYARQYDLKNLRVTGMTATEPKPRVSVSLRVWAENPSGPSDWQLEWEKTGQGWQLLKADPKTDFATLSELIPRPGGQ
jgi:hypothetical protein